MTEGWVSGWDVTLTITTTVESGLGAYVRVLLMRRTLRATDTCNLQAAFHQALDFASRMIHPKDQSPEEKRGPIFDHLLLARRLHLLSV